LNKVHYASRISTLRDRVCMTAAMLVLEPIFEADLPPEQYAYVRPTATAPHLDSTNLSRRALRPAWKN
jgi:hypothetical protein